MATQKKIIEMIGSVKTIYPYYAKDTDVQILVKTWTLLLKDYPDKAVDVAFFKCLQTCKMPPTPADVIEQLNSMADALEATDEELWSVYTKALKDAEPHIYRMDFNCALINEDPRQKLTEIWEGLPERLRYYIGSKGEFKRMSRDFTDTDLKFEKQRFLKTMPSMKKRAEYNQIAALLEGDLKQIEGG